MSARITVRKDGPYRVEGEFTLVDHDGNAIAFDASKPISLCRCGGSTKKPFCDGTHTRIGFRAAEEAQRAHDVGRIAHE